MKKCAVFSCPGLGDGLISLMLANNLKLNGYDTITFHNNNLGQLQKWFCHLPIAPFPLVEEIDNILKEYEKIFISYDESSSFTQQLIKKGKAKRKDTVFVLNPSFSLKVGEQKFYKDAYFSPYICMVDNIKMFCEKILKLKYTTRDVGFVAPEGFIARKNISRVIIHPTSTKRGRNWSAKKYVKVALHLKKDGFIPVFVINKQEQKWCSWIGANNLRAFVFSSLENLTAFVYESGYMIGNDSGVGHLASLLGLPTLTICRSHRLAKLWRPGWSKGEILFPSKFIPNIRGFRWRDRKWQNFISERKVIRAFYGLIGLERGLSI